MIVFQLNIRTKIFLAIIIVVLVVFLDTFYITFYKSSQFLVNQAKEDHLQLLATLSSDIKNEMTYTEKIMDIVTIEIDKNKNIPEQIEVIKNRCKRFGAIFAFDSNGKVIFISDHSRFDIKPSLIYKSLKDSYPEFIKIKKSLIFAPLHPALKDYLLCFFSVYKYDRR